MRILPAIGIMIAAIGLTACTVVERDRPQAAAPSPIIVQQPAPQMMAPQQPTTVTVRPSY